jgi:hypothetical protein
VLELLGIAMLIALTVAGRTDVPFAARYLGVFVAGGTLISVMGLVIERVMCPRYRRVGDYALLAAYALADNFGYRQCTALWRVRGLWNALRRKGRWGEMQRRGHEKAEAKGAAERRAA